jgi:hypothetical protein
MTPSVDSLLAEAQRAYGAGDAHGALAAWYRVLEVVPGHPAALQYIAFVRKVLNLDASTTSPPAMTTSPPAMTPSPPAMTEVAPASVPSPSDAVPSAAAAVPLESSPSPPAMTTPPATTMSPPPAMADAPPAGGPVLSDVVPSGAASVPSTPSPAMSPPPAAAPLARLSWADLVDGPDDAPIRFETVDRAVVASSHPPSFLPARPTQPTPFPGVGATADDEAAGAPPRPSASPAAGTPAVADVAPDAPAAAAGGPAALHASPLPTTTPAPSPGAEADVVPAGPGTPVDVVSASVAAVGGPSSLPPVEAAALDLVVPPVAPSPPPSAPPGPAHGEPPRPPPLPRTASASMFPAGHPEERVARPSIRFDEPTPMTAFLRTASLPGSPATEPPPAPVGVPHEVSASLFPAGRPEERVVRASVRFDDVPGASPTRSLTQDLAAPVLPPAQPATTTSPSQAAASQPASHPPSSASAPLTAGDSPAVLATASPSAAAQPPRGASPWDDDAGPGAVLDLDQAPPPPSPTWTQALQGGGTALDQARVVTPTPALPPAAAAPADDGEGLMVRAREAFELGDFSGSLALVEQVLKRHPDHEGARAYLQRNEATLTKMYESKLGDLSRAPRQILRPDEVIWMNMHHRAGFVLSLVDGTLSYEDLVDVSGLRRLDAVRILADLVGSRIIA